MTKEIERETIFVRIAYCYQCATTLMGRRENDRADEYERVIEAHRSSHCQRSCCEPINIYPLCECGETVASTGVGYYSNEGWICKTCKRVHTPNGASRVRFSGVAQFLERARNVIAQPATWTQCAEARTMGGEGVDGYYESAVQWCAVGALAKARTTYDIKSLSPVRTISALSFDMLRAVLPEDWETVSGFNDFHQTTHADIMALYDRAIARAEREAQQLS